MKILLVNDYGTPHGGAEIATIRLRDGLRARGHDCLLFASSAHEGQLPTAADVETLGTTSRWRTMVQTVNWPAQRDLRRVLADFRPDVVHVGMFLTQLSPAVLPVLRAWPTVYYAHWLRAICPTGHKQLPDGSVCTSHAGGVCYRAGCLPLRDWAAHMVQRALLARWRGAFNRVVANSEATRNALINEWRNMSDGTVDHDIAVIPCGVPVVPLDASSTVADAPTVVCAGRLTRQKGVHVLLEAWRHVVAEHPTAQLWIMGDGPERHALEQSSPPRVQFLGHLAPDALRRKAQLAWVHVVPSVGFESFGLSATEAMMRGTAVVASDVGGLPEIVLDDVTGRIVPPKDSAALAAALTTLLANRDRCAAMGARARERAELLFSESRYVERFEALFASMMASRTIA